MEELFSKHQKNPSFLVLVSAVMKEQSQGAGLRLLPAVQQ
jgi:hypothetical protein